TRRFLPLLSSLKRPSARREQRSRHGGAAIAGWRLCAAGGAEPVLGIELAGHEGGAGRDSSAAVPRALPHRLRAPAAGDRSAARRRAGAEAARDRAAAARRAAQRDALAPVLGLWCF